MKTLERALFEEARRGNIRESRYLDNLKIAPQLYEYQTDALLAGRGDKEQPK